jgi:hypothetical protein
VAEATVVAQKPDGPVDGVAVSRALTRVVEVTARHLDAAARGELETLAQRTHDAA